eukprot:COSAG06_NODE_34_length_31045_cov_28.806469_25_plen_72_part_00
MERRQCHGRAALTQVRQKLQAVVVLHRSDARVAQRASRFPKLAAEQVPTRTMLHTASAPVSTAVILLDCSG